VCSHSSACVFRPRSTWSEYYQLRGLDPASPLALIVHPILTLYHILVTLRLVGPDRQARDRPLRVHLLGVDGQEWGVLPFWRELAILLPDEAIEVDMVGNALGDGAAGHRQIFRGRLGGRVVCRFHKATYSSGEQARLGVPDVAVALNAGLGQPEYEWRSALAALARTNTPFVYTDYTEFGVDVGQNLINASYHKEGMRVTLPAALNPFRQPLRWPDAHGGCFTVPWLANGFFSAAGTPLISARV